MMYVPMVEALVFASPEPITEEEILNILQTHSGEMLSPEDVNQLVNEMVTSSAESTTGFQLVRQAGGLVYVTRPDHHGLITVLVQNNAKRKLSQATLETLALIAYKQPVTKSELEFIRGVNCDYAVQKLLERELIRIAGKSDGPGKPVLYETTKTFMEYFGINSLEELPDLKDVQADVNEIGDPS